MNQNDIDALMKATAGVVRSYVERAISPAIERMIALEARPIPQDGKDGAPGRDGVPGKDGASLTLDDIRPLIDDAVPALVKAETAPLIARIAELEAREPVKGEKGEPGETGEPGSSGKDGKDAPAPTVEQIEQAIKGMAELSGLIETAVMKQWDAKPPKDGANGLDGAAGKDGATVADVLSALNPTDEGIYSPLKSVVIDHLKQFPAPAGRDGRDGQQGIPGRDGKDGANGLDGLGFDDLTVEHDGERAITMKFVRGEQVKEFSLVLPVPIDRGPWKEGEYVKGDGVSLGGQFWIARRDTSDKPDFVEGGAWRLAVKKGRDGKDLRPDEGKSNGPVRFK